ncbi:peptidase [Russula dissimulans]|nr:peptidase [Russula dissimulans]
MKPLRPLLALVLLATSSAAIPAALRVDNAPEYPLSLESSEELNWNLQDRRLVQFAPDAEPVWITELEKIQAKAAGLNFMDITEAQDLDSPVSIKSQSSVFKKPKAYKAVKRVIKELSTEGPEENLHKFTSFHTRHYRTKTGRESQQWLAGRIEEITGEFAGKSLRDLITIQEFDHPWGQNTIIVRINGSSPGLTDDGVVIVGAHQDSTNFLPFLAAPGADDDGSGTVTILEAYRALIASDFRPVHPVEFHWYSAEEGGLLGSQAVAKDYKAKGVKVIAMSQFDMTAWVKTGTREEVGIITDFVDPDITALNKQLVNAYLDIPYVETQCGYACSDHASWTKAGYPSSFTIESEFRNSNPHIHSANDRIDISHEFSFEHMLEFSKLAVAFVIELGGWRNYE